MAASRALFLGFSMRIGPITRCCFALLKLGIAAMAEVLLEIGRKALFSGY
jgi:hypothetical protein